MIFAIGNNELGDPLGKKARCPKCLKMHTVEFGKDSEGNETKMLAFVDCKKHNASYLVGINGRQIP